MWSMRFPRLSSRPPRRWAQENQAADRDTLAAEPTAHMECSTVLARVAAASRQLASRRLRQTDLAVVAEFQAQQIQILPERPTTHLPVRLVIALAVAGQSPASSLARPQDLAARPQVRAVLACPWRRTSAAQPQAQAGRIARALARYSVR